MTWRSKKQNVVSLFSAKVEYRALHHAITKLTWLRILLSKLGFGLKKPMVLFCDNTIAIEIANNSVQHDQTKHIELDRNYIKDKLVFGIIKVPYIKSANQMADMRTHVVTNGPYYTSLSKFGICDIYAPTSRGKSTIGTAESSCQYSCVQLSVHLCPTVGTAMYKHLCSYQIVVIYYV